MINLDDYIKDLTGKDEDKARVVAEYLVNNVDIDLFKMLIYKSEFLFDFVKANVCKRIENAVTKENFKNIIKFFEVYSYDYDDLFVGILAKHASQDLTDEIFEMLENGTEEQKAYCAKYFYYIPDTIAIESLSKYAFSDSEALSFNSAQALGQMRDDVSYDIALNNLNSNDDFEKLKAVKFFVAYMRKPPIENIYTAMLSSAMPENIAGQIPYLASMTSLISQEDKINALITTDNILSGLGEILPLSEIFQFEMYEIIEKLIHFNQSDNKDQSKIAQILLKSLSKFKMLCENQEYIFDENKDTKQELSAILKLMQGQSKEFWQKQKQYVIEELQKDDKRILSALNVIEDFNITDAVPQIKQLLNSKNEIVICECINTLKKLNVLAEINKEEILDKLNNENIKAIIENIWG